MNHSINYSSNGLQTFFLSTPSRMWRIVKEWLSNSYSLVDIETEWLEISCRIYGLVDELCSRHNLFDIFCEHKKNSCFDDRFKKT